MIYLESSVLTVKFCPVPSHEPKPNVVFFVQESVPEQTSKRHSSERGSQPRKAFAKEDFPDPVAPTITILGLGSSGTRRLWPNAMGKMVRRKILIETILDFVKLTQLSLSCSYILEGATTKTSL